MANNFPSTKGQFMVNFLFWFSELRFDKQNGAGNKKPVLTNKTEFECENIFTQIEGGGLEGAGGLFTQGSQVYPNPKVEQ